LFINLVLRQQPALAVPTETNKLWRCLTLVEQTGMIEHNRVHKIVVEHHIRLAQQLETSQRDERRFARPSTDEIDFASFHNLWVLGVMRLKYCWARRIGESNA
jgi:hypothetical protein